MRHVNYSRWAAYAIGLFHQADGAVRSVLDVACGTGSLMVEIANAGYEVSGFDFSFRMVKQARQKLEARRLISFNPSSPTADAPAIPKFWCGDMRGPGVRESFDVALCLYDSMNYCPGLNAVAEALHGIAGAIRSGGLLIFDVCTERNCRAHFNNYYERDGAAEYSYTRHSYFDRRRHKQMNEFLIVDECDGSRYWEVHEQKVFHIDELRALCNNEHWGLLGCYDGFTRRPGDENSDRVHFLLKRR